MSYCRIIESIARSSHPGQGCKCVDDESVNGYVSCDGQDLPTCPWSILCALPLCVGDTCDTAGSEVAKTIDGWILLKYVAAFNGSPILDVSKDGHH